MVIGIYYPCTNSSNILYSFLSNDLNAIASSEFYHRFEYCIMVGCRVVDL